MRGVDDTRSDPPDSTAPPLFSLWPLWQTWLYAILDVFTVTELGQRSDELLRAAEQGRLSLITTNGRPAILAIPFDERLLNLGIHRAMAVHLFESGQTTLSQGARLAGISMEE